MSADKTGQGAPAIDELVREVLAACRERQWLLATAESCTGGMVASAVTAVPGSSDVLDCGFVTYSNAAKSRMLGVPPDLIFTHGAVSEPVAIAMATGALRQSSASISVSITGIAGPGGGSDGKPVGLVHFACATSAGHMEHLERRYGDLGRSAIRSAALADALRLIVQACGFR